MLSFSVVQTAAGGSRLDNTGGRARGGTYNLDNDTIRQMLDEEPGENMDISSLYNLPNGQVDGCINIQAPGNY